MTETAEEAATTQVLPCPLAEKAINVNLSIGCWTASRVDRGVSGEVKENKEAKSDAGAWVTKLLPPSAMKGVYAAAGALKAVHLRLTLPWGDDGSRILPNALFLEYVREHQHKKDAFEEEVKKFLEKYPTYVEEAQQRLGKLFNPAMFPSIDEVRDKFHTKLNTWPIPTTDFRADIGEDALKEMQEQVGRQLKEREGQILRWLYTRLRDGLRRFAESVGSPKGKPSVIQESLKEVCNTLPNLNLTSDEKLEQIRQQIVTTILPLTKEQLKTNKDQIIADTQQITDELATLVG